MPEHPKVTVGILVYKGKKYFPFLFESLFNQDYPNIEILVLDNASPSNDAAYLEKQYGQKITVIRNEENIGFAAGHNMLIKKMSGEYYFCLNQDIFLEHNFISRIIKVFKKDSRIGTVTGKIKQWDFQEGANGKSNILDTTGIQASAGQHFTDRGQGESDHSQYDTAAEIFAASGAAVIYRKSALENIAFTPNKLQATSYKLPPEYFDELMFMYKEDIDLGYRLRWHGWKCIYAPEAIAYHDRSVHNINKNLLGALKNQKQKSKKILYWSWLHQHILLQKNFSKDFSLRTKWKTFWRKLLMNIYMVFLEPKIFWRVKKELREKQEIITQKQNALQKRVPAEEIEQFFK